MTPEAATIDNKVKRVVSNISNLPTPPIVFHQIQKVINDPNSTVTKIAAVLAEDPATSVKVLKLTNSAFYGLSHEVTSVKQAVMVVGMEAIKNLVLSASVLDMFKGDDKNVEFQDSFWRHSLASAFCCRLLARSVRSRGIVDPDSAFSCGLLHDIGKIVMCFFLPEEWANLRERREQDDGIPDHELETEVLGYNHAQIGGILAEQWKLPAALGDAISRHHSPMEGEAETPTAHLVNVASYLSRETFPGGATPQAPGQLAEGVADYLGLTPVDMETHMASLREEYVKAETFMQMAGISS
jgi:putative nucleotidyltransferase with HDIG domain